MTLTATEVMDRLRTKYKEPEWAIFHQVPDATGGQHRRTADAVAMNLWPSRGLEVLGFEIKVRRGDWLRELKNPKKAEDGVYPFCDRWYVATGERDLVRDGELPGPWGLMTPYGKGLRVSVEAPPKESQPLDRAFVAAVLRRAQRTPELWRDEQLREARELGRKEGRADAAHEVEVATELQQRIEARVREFEEASGIKIIGGWKLGEIGEAVRLVVGGDFGKGDIKWKLSHLLQEADRVTKCAEEVRKGLAQLEGVEA